MSVVITPRHIWFLLAVTQHDPKRPAHIEPPPFQACLAWHHDFLFKHGLAETPAAEALDAVQSVLH
jgi:hypothetical protein